MTKMGTIKKIRTKVQEWRTTAKSQECDTTTKSKEWIEITRASTKIKLGSGITGATNEAYEMALIEEAIEKVEQDIVEGTELLAGNETKNEDTWDKT